MDRILDGRTEIADFHCESHCLRTGLQTGIEGKDRMTGWTGFGRGREEMKNGQLDAGRKGISAIAEFDEGACY